MILLLIRKTIVRRLVVMCVLAFGLAFLSSLSVAYEPIRLGGLGYLTIGAVFITVMMGGGYLVNVNHYELPPSEEIMPYYYVVYYKANEEGVSFEQLAREGKTISSDDSIVTTDLFYGQGGAVDTGYYLYPKKMVPVTQIPKVAVEREGLRTMFQWSYFEEEKIKKRVGKHYTPVLSACLSLSTNILLPNKSRESCAKELINKINTVGYKRSAIAKMEATKWAAIPSDDDITMPVFYVTSNNYVQFKFWKKVLLYPYTENLDVIEIDLH